ncbi:hypothetical protein B0H10DRAFT_1940678 [Mycena sp. CBHHK59/15]|nr:hypothetical protein B0H10DRAFT_1940678 [Mycena sp. CBHHK59/15]
MIQWVRAKWEGRGLKALPTSTDGGEEEERMFQVFSSLCVSTSMPHWLPSLASFKSGANHIQICKAIPTENITHLDVRYLAKLAPASWKLVLARLPALGVGYLFIHQAAVALLDTMIQLANSPVNIDSQPRCIHIFTHIVGAGLAIDKITPDVSNLHLIGVLHVWGTPQEVLKIQEQHGRWGMEEEFWLHLSVLVGKLVRNSAAICSPQSREKHTPAIVD